ncbi:MAG: hypothetical protein LC649_09235 [Bacteroidales bacterium]|nr:hypothetical protein [Bacteroidales bacterium]
MEDRVIEAIALRKQHVIQDNVDGWNPNSKGISNKRVNQGGDSGEATS